MKAVRSPFLCATLATVRRECLSHSVNRFLYWHLALLTVAGVLAVLTSPENQERGVAWFVLYAVLYALSLSSLLLGLSSAQAEHDEMPFLRTQPAGMAPWVTGKAIGLTLIVAPSALLLVLPWLAASGWSRVLALLAAATAGICVVLTLLGLAVGLWIREPVRGLIGAVAGWFLLLFATDLLLILVAGSPWIHAHSAVWIAPLMLNPFDAFRVSVLFAVERAAFNTLGAGPLVTWWTAHAGAWLTCCIGLWVAAMYLCALGGARRRRG